MNTAAAPSSARIALEGWLTRLDGARLECDGMSRCISMLCTRQGIAHEVQIGSLSVAGLGSIGHHWWLHLLDSGELVDLRARMWLGLDPRVPHGVFKEVPGACYVPQATASVPVSDLIFEILCGYSLDSFISKRR